MERGKTYRGKKAVGKCLALAVGICLLPGGIAQAADKDIAADETWTITASDNTYNSGTVTVADGGVIDLVGVNLDRTGDHDGNNHYQLDIGTLSGTATFYVAASTINRPGEGVLLEGDVINITTLDTGAKLKIGVYSKNGAIKTSDYAGSDFIVRTSSTSQIYSDTNVSAVTHTWGSKTYTPVLGYKLEDIGGGINLAGVYIKSVSLNGGAEGNENTQTMADTKYALNDLWLAEANNLQNRMGDLRALQPAKAGAWVRYSGGELRPGSGREAKLRYNMVQLGYDQDKKVSDGVFYRGGALSYSKGSTTFASGSGDVHEGTLSLYQTWVGNKGHYYDVIVKTGRYSDDYNVLLDEGTALSHADYHTWAASVSGEYGYRKQLGDGMYIEPEGELILGRVNGANYTIQDSRASMEAANHAITRLGVAYGKDFSNGSNVYLRGSWFHEFGGSMAISLDDTMYRRDPARNWYEMSLGGNFKAADNCNIYMELAKDFGDIHSSLKVNTGARWSF